jgi:hypothetical protein
MKSSLLILLSSAATLSLANPIPGDTGPTALQGCGTRDPTSSVTVTDKQVGIDGVAIVGAASCKPQDGTKCTLSRSVTYTVSKSVSVGITPFGQTGTESVIGASISVSVSWSTAKGTVDGSGSDCPVVTDGSDQWTCALNIIPAVARVSGKQTTNTENNLICDIKENQDYTVDLPLVNGDGNPNVRTELCSCPDEIGCDSPGAPQHCAGPCRTAGATK